MKRMIVTLAFAMPALMVAASGNDDKTKYTVNTDASTVIWHGSKVTGKHDGTISLKSGELTFENNMLVGGTFVMDMTSIKNTDMAGSRGAEKLEGHLMSDDFFGVEKYPTATFKITKAVPYGTSGDYKIVGDMTIKDNTNEVKFMANIDMSDGMRATAEIELDRSEYDVRYGSGSFFDNLGDKAISDIFKLNVELVFNNAS
ncbi:MAG: YceI family protein [Saprospiraceae bacterium]|nr:YceI family protein [Saprospiraceae bacterium]